MRHKILSKSELIEFLDPPNNYPIMAANMLGISLKSLYLLSYKHNICFPRPPKGFNIFFREQLELQKKENKRFRARIKSIQNEQTN